MPLSEYNKRPAKGFQYGSKGGGRKAPSKDERKDKVQLSPEAKEALTKLKEGSELSSQQQETLTAPYVGAERGWLARLLKGPGYKTNPTVEDLNTQILTEQVGRDIFTPQDLAKTEQETLIQTLARLGIGRGDIEGRQAVRNTSVAQQGAGQKKAEAEGEEATTRKMLEVETRTPRRRIAQQTAQRGVAESTRQTRAAMSGEGQDAIGGRYLAEQLAPIFNLRKAATIDVSPGELSQFSGQGLPDTLQKILGPGFTARGMMSNEQPRFGQPIGSSGIRPFLGMERNTIPGGIYPNISQQEISQFIGSQEQPSSLTTPSITAPPRTMPGRGSGGLSIDARSTLPMEMIQAQPEQETLVNILRRIFSGATLGGMR